MTLGIVSRLDAMERKFLRAAPRTYPVLSNILFIVGAVLMTMTAGVEMEEGDSQWVLLLLVALFFFGAFLCYLGRSCIFLIYRQFTAPFRPGAPLWTTLVSSICLIGLCSSICAAVIDYYGIVISGFSQPVLEAHRTVVQSLWSVWYMILSIAGGRAHAARVKNSSQVVEAQETSAGQGAIPHEKGDAASALEVREDPSFVRDVLAVLEDPENKAERDDTLWDIRNRVLGHVVVEILYCGLTYSMYKIMQKFQQSQGTDNEAPLWAVVIMTAAFSVLLVFLIVYPIVAYRWTRQHWKAYANRVSKESMPDDTVV